MAWVRENGSAGDWVLVMSIFEGGRIDAVLKIATFADSRSLFSATFLLIAFGITFEQVSNGNWLQFCRLVMFFFFFSFRSRFVLCFITEI